MMNNTELLKNLKEFGMTEYEAKAYQTILAIKEGTAWSISKSGNIPQSKIYEIMSNLEKKGFIEKSATKPLIFRVIYPSIALRNYIGRYCEETKAKLKHLKKIAKEIEKGIDEKEIKNEISLIWTLKGKNNVYNKATSMIASTERECLIAGHRPLAALNCIKTLGKIAKNKDIKIRVLGNFSKNCIDFMNNTGIEYKVVDSFYEYMLIIDEKNLLLAFTQPDGELFGINILAKESIMANKNHFELLWNIKT
jgi:sugar-specific transcriptional regulator TrmB